MQIQGILLRPGNNLLHEAGDLDAQIAHDFEDLTAQLREYQTEHLDKKVKGRSNHYEQWSEENKLKIQYANRIACLARMACEDAKDTFTQEEFEAMSAPERQVQAVRTAKYLVSRVGPYDMKTVYAERQSMHPDDWYLWTVAAFREDTREWSVWSMNLSLGGLNGGVYGIPDMKSCNKAIARKKNALAEKQPVSSDEVEQARQALLDGGMDPDAVPDVLRNLAYILTGTELRTEKESEE